MYAKAKLTTQPTDPPKQAPPPPLDAKSADFLRSEIERLQSLYVHMDGSAQSVFNFYLTFVSTARVGVASGISVGAVLFGTVVIFLMALLIYNVYSHWVMRSIITRLQVQIWD